MLYAYGESHRLIFEVQRGGSNSSEPDKNGIRQRRILFYTRFGAKIFKGLHYLLPNAHGGEPEDMYLMMVPNPDIPYIDKNSVIRIIKRIYLAIYPCYESDLLDRTIAGLPSRIRLISEGFGRFYLLVIVVRWDDLVAS
jgi:hypothetical protein